MGSSGDDDPPATAGRDTLASIDEETKVDGILQSEILGTSEDVPRAPRSDLRVPPPHPYAPGESVVAAPPPPPPPPPPRAVPPPPPPRKAAPPRALEAPPTIEMTSAELRNARSMAGAPASEPPPSIAAIHAALYGEAPPPSVRPPPVVAAPIVSVESAPVPEVVVPLEEAPAPAKISAAPAATLAEEMSRQIGEHMTQHARDRPPRAQPSSLAPPPESFAPRPLFLDSPVASYPVGDPVAHRGLDEAPEPDAAPPRRRAIRRSVVLPWPAIVMLIAIVVATIVEHAWRGDLVESILGSLHAVRLFFDHL